MRKCFGMVIMLLRIKLHKLTAALLQHILPIPRHFQSQTS